MEKLKIQVADWQSVVSPKKDWNATIAVTNMAMRNEIIDYRKICGCCGKELKDPSKIKLLHLIEGGAYFTEYKENVNECHGSDMGWFPVGELCYKKYINNTHTVEISVEK